jgi:hypothetical protein
LAGRRGACGQQGADQRGRLRRLIDATAVPKPGVAARRGNGVWRIHSAFDLPAERFSCFALTEERGGERRDRVPVEPGEIRVADRADRQPDRLAAVLTAGGDVVVQAAWRNAAWLDAAWLDAAWLDAAWLDAAGEPLDLIAALCAGVAHGLIDRPIGVPRRGEAPPLRRPLVAIKKSPQAAQAARHGATRKKAGTASLRRPWRQPIG